MLSRVLSFIALSGVTAGFASADEPLLPPTKKFDWYAKAVKKVEATVEPAETKPGQTATFRLTVTLTDETYTYPLKQLEKAAANDVNKITWPAAAGVVFVGDATDSPKFKTRPEPALEIKALRYYEGTVTYERKFVVNPTATAGDTTIALPEFKFSACHKGQCYPGKVLKPEAKFKVLPGPAVPVEAAFADEVKAALEKKDEKK